MCKKSKVFGVSNLYLFYLPGNYKVEVFDKSANKFVPTVSGLGMHVEIKDPESKVILSRVSCLFYVFIDFFTYTHG